MPGRRPTAPPVQICARLGLTARSPYREPMFPGIYGNPKEIVAEAAERVATESLNLKKVFGVTRADLADIGEQSPRAGNIDPARYLKMATRRGRGVAPGSPTGWRCAGAGAAVGCG
jgi:hypothetical protein